LRFRVPPSGKVEEIMKRRHALFVNRDRFTSEVWVENETMVEILPPDYAAEYLASPARQGPAARRARRRRRPVASALIRKKRLIETVPRRAGLPRRRVRTAPPRRHKPRSIDIVKSPSARPNGVVEMTKQ
jgi:hypothetical protein